MGGITSKAQAYEQKKHGRLEAALGPPSKTMDASSYSQELVMLVSKTIESHLGLLPVPGKRRSFTATQMMTRDLHRNKNNNIGIGTEEKKNDGTMYYIKVRTDVRDWPWVFVKVFSPPQITGVSRVSFEGMKKMKEDYKLVTF